MGEFFKKMRTEVNSRIRPLIRFNRRERLRKKFALYLLLVLLTTIVFEEGQAIIAQASTGGEIELSVKTGVVETPASQPISGVIKTPASVKSQESNAGDDGIISMIRKISAQEGFNNPEGIIRLATCESRLSDDCRTYSDKCINPKNNSFDRGYLQISRKYHPEVTDAEAFNPEYAVKWTINMVKSGQINQWACAGAYLN